MSKGKQCEACEMKRARGIIYAKEVLLECLSQRRASMFSNILRRRVVLKMEGNHCRTVVLGMIEQTFLKLLINV